MSGGLGTAQQSFPPDPSVFRGIPYLSKHLGDRMKRLGDFLNMESFDLALLEEVSCFRGTGVEAWLGGGAAWGSWCGRRLSPWGKGQAGVIAPSPRCGASRTSST